MENLVIPNPMFWSGRRVLVTGHTGFKGAWLVLWLESLGARVTGLALAPSSIPNLYTLAPGKGPSIVADIRDFTAVAACVEQERPEVIFHLAAQALVRPSYDDPVGTYATNVMGTVHLLEAARRTGGVSAIVNVTSDKCYENREWPWAYREDEAMGGFDPYSSSKGCAELVTAAYRRSFFDADGPALASARAGNVIGGGDWALDRIVPDCIRAFSSGETVVVRSPNATRPWQHVLEPLSGYLLLAERLCSDGAAAAQAWNFGPSEDDAKPVSTVVEALVNAWGNGAAWRLTDAPQPHEANYLKIDASRARQRLGWRPRLSFAQAISWTVQWYRQQLDAKDARALCLAQIDAYQRMGTTP